MGRKVFFDAFFFRCGVYLYEIVTKIQAFSLVARQNDCTRHEGGEAQAMLR